MIVLAIGCFLIGAVVGGRFVLKNNTEIMLKTFQDMTEEDLLKWYHKKVKNVKMEV